MSQYWSLFQASMDQCCIFFGVLISRNISMYLSKGYKITNLRGYLCSIYLLLREKKCCPLFKPANFKQIITGEQDLPRDSWYWVTRHNHWVHLGYTEMVLLLFCNLGNIGMLSKCVHVLEVTENLQLKYHVFKFPLLYSSSKCLKIPKPSSDNLWAFSS